MNLNQRQKIVFILTKLELGGAQKHALDLIKGLDKDRFEVSLITSDGFLYREAEGLTGLRLVIIKSLKREINIISDLRTFFKIYCVLQHLKPDIVHTHSSKAGLIGRWAAWFSGVPVIIHTIHGFGFNEYQKVAIRKLYIFLERITAFITDRLIAVSDNTLRQGLEAGIGLDNYRQKKLSVTLLLVSIGRELLRIPLLNGDYLRKSEEKKSHKYTVIKYGISKDILLTKTDTSLKKKELGIKDGVPVVGMVSCLKPQKSPTDFIKSASIILKELPDARFVLVGDGVMKSRLVKLIDKLGMSNKVILTGFRRDAIEIISTFDVFVLTSLWEGLPIVFLEAMALSKPIVAMDTGSSAELVKDGVNGYLVNSKDYIALADKVTFLLKNRDVLNGMGLNGRHIFNENQFFLEKMLKQIYCLYDSLLIDTQKSQGFRPIL
jgi:glycosyltransferase involved in cell wall biosynthesis